jgi:hypothetical protein
VSAVSGEHAPDQPHDPRAALERLADAFDEHHFSITLTAPDEHPPKLSISNRHCPLSEHVFADERFYWFAWGEPIGPVDDPVTAAAKIARVLRAVPEPSHG